ncbi:MAG: GDYXXLXY domain-containing protein [Clostridiales bacterium]
MKKLTFYLLIGYFVLQLAFPGYFIYRHYNTLYTGESYKFVVAPYDPYDPFRGRYVALRPVLTVSSSDGQYALLDKDAEGYAIITGWQEQKPAQGQFAKELQLDRYYMNEKMAPEAERIQLNPASDEDRFYLLVKVKNGDYVIQGLYINDIPIEEYITKG